jgi:hypothetical protein
MSGSRALASPFSVGPLWARLIDAVVPFTSSGAMEQQSRKALPFKDFVTGQHRWRSSPRSNFARTLAEKRRARLVLATLRFSAWRAHRDKCGQVSETEASAGFGAPSGGGRIVGVSRGRLDRLV